MNFKGDLLINLLTEWRNEFINLLIYLFVEMIY